jgi:two-component system response regulator AtoC
VIDGTFKMAHALIVDDDRSIRRTLEKLLVGEGYGVASAADGVEALHAIRTSAIDVVLLDLGLPQMDGLEVLAAAQSIPGAPPIVVITAREDMNATVRAVQLGAYDYLVKPLDIDRIKLAVRRAVQSREAARTLSELISRAAQDYQIGNIVGRSAVMREIYKTIGAVSTSRASVLIEGESGTGKELVAKAIHYASADREKPFVAVNCTALSRELLESELFGHVRGAFTGAIADKIGRFELAGSGTLFLDEIAEIPHDLQAKLLRVLQERTFERVGDTKPVPLRARVITATHRNLAEMTRAGTFREDLLYRLKVVEMKLPPLRERLEDLPLLIESLLAKINRDLHKRVTYATPEALAILHNYSWPGNVRELENALTRAVVLAKGTVLEPAHLPITAHGDATAPAAIAAPPGAADASDAAILPLHEVEKRHIARTLAHTEWNKRRACALLEISRPTLDRKIEEYSLAREPG